MCLESLRSKCLESLGAGVGVWSHSGALVTPELGVWSHSGASVLESLTQE